MKKNTLKIRTRLVVAFLIVICTPLFLIGVGSIIFTNYQLKAIENYYNIEGEGIEAFSNTTRLLDGLTQKIHKEILSLAKYSPDSLENEAMLEKINGQLKDKYSFLLVLKDKNVIYNGNTSEDVKGIYESLKKTFEAVRCRSVL